MTNPKGTGEQSTISSTNAPRFQPRRRLPIGAEVLPEGGVHFRIWAPRVEAAAVKIAREAREFDDSDWLVELEPEEGGYFSMQVPEATAGLLYKVRLGRELFPDPASRFQPGGPHGPSQIIDPAGFPWTDRNWRGVEREGQVIYEMHIGAFTGAGTWAAAQEELPELARFGITVVEVMPVADFPGRFGWGYDGVDLFAPTRLYGTPDDFRAFVDRAHAVGLGVILDVVYNHLGPDGNYLKQFSADYFSDRYTTEWGEALNFDGPNSGPVREFYISNAGYWIDEFHLDGLRLDATQQIFDRSPENILAALARQVRAAAQGRSTLIVAENESQQMKLVRPVEQDGYGLDALWNDDFHHSALVALTGRNEAYYTDYRGGPQEFISALKWGCLYQGQWYSWQKQGRGTPGFGLDPAQFVTYIQNHDQVANSLRGQRVHELASAGKCRAITALLLLGPGTPMLFQGQEFAASSPFYYFADHQPELAELVASGRKEFLAQFRTIASSKSRFFLARPESEETFLRSKLDFAEREKHGHIYRLHRDLLQLRRENALFRQQRRGGMDGAVLAPETFVLRFFAESGEDWLLVVNLGGDLDLESMPEPLLAPVEGCVWRVAWSSEDPEYGGSGTPALDLTVGWQIPGRTALVLAPEKR